MNPKQIENEALGLPEEQRAELAQKLIISLEAGNDDEIAQQWQDEAHRRARDLDEGLVKAVPAEEVSRKARALLR